jgi:LacI family transcriptional regulator
MVVDDPLIERLFESKRPFITIGRHPTNDEISYVDVDNHTGAYQGVSHIVSTGRRRVGMINGPHNTIASLDRYRGYADALRDHHVPIIPELLAEGVFSDATGYQEMKRLLPYCPDAIFAASDAMALAAMRAILEEGLRIPEDIAVVGFDDIPSSANSRPPLTTVRQPIQQTGSMAAEILVDMIENPTAPARHVVLPTNLVIRSTC